MAASKQTFKHTHARAQCSNASVGLAQARPNKLLYLQIHGTAVHTPTIKSPMTYTEADPETI